MNILHQSKIFLVNSNCDLGKNPSIKQKQDFIHYLDPLLLSKIPPICFLSPDNQKEQKKIFDLEIFSIF